MNSRGNPLGTDVGVPFPRLYRLAWLSDVARFSTTTAGTDMRNAYMLYMGVDGAAPSPQD